MSGDLSNNLRLSEGLHYLLYFNFLPAWAKQVAALETAFWLLVLLLFNLIEHLPPQQNSLAVEALPSIPQYCLVLVNIA